MYLDGDLHVNLNLYIDLFIYILYMLTIYEIKESILDYKTNGVLV